LQLAFCVYLALARAYIKEWANATQKPTRMSFFSPDPISVNSHLTFVSGSAQAPNIHEKQTEKNYNIN
jgi:hypothetical protein